jgi:hypothetical protein
LHELADSASVQLGYTGLKKKLMHCRAQGKEYALRQSDGPPVKPHLLEHHEPCGKDLPALLSCLGIQDISVPLAVSHKRVTLRQKCREYGFFGTHLRFANALEVALSFLAIIVCVTVVGTILAPGVTSVGGVFGVILGLAILGCTIVLKRRIEHARSAGDWQWEALPLSQYQKHDVPIQALCNALLIRDHLPDAEFFVEQLVLGTKVADSLLYVKHSDHVACIGIWGDGAGLGTKSIDQT